MIYPGSIKRIQATFTTEAEAKYDPDSQTLKFYDSIGALIATKTQADCVRSELGIWYIDYTVPTTAVTGRWTCEWTATVTGKGDYIYVHVFDVWSLFWPTVDEVRNYLANICDDRLSEDTIVIQLRLAIRHCERYCSSSTIADIASAAMLARAGWMSYIAYVTMYERSVGQVPPAMLGHSAVLEGLALEAMLACGATIDARKAGPINSFTPTVVPETYEKTAEGRG